MDAQLLEVAEAHVRMIASRVGLQVMDADTRAQLGNAARVGADFIKRLKALPQPKELEVEELAPSGMALFALVKGYEKGLQAVLEAVKRHIPELAPFIEELAA